MRPLGTDETEHTPGAAAPAAHVPVRKLLLALCLGLCAPVALAQTTPTAPVPMVAPETPTAPAPMVAPDTPPAPASPQPNVSDPSDLTPTTPDIVDASPVDSPLTTTNGTPSAALAPEAPVQPLTQQEAMMLMAQDASTAALTFLRNGGPSIWAISALSLITLTLILWKIWRLALIGAWSRGKAGKALTAFESGRRDEALEIVRGRRGIRSIVIYGALSAVSRLPENRAREETARIAKREIGNAGTGLRALELIATIAPLLGLLGTVLGMIAAFQALQQAGSRADPALLAGGIWEALLTTAAGMAVAIPASAALTWFEAVIDRIRRDVEDGAARVFIAQEPEQIRLAAE